MDRETARDIESGRAREMDSETDTQRDSKRQRAEGLVEGQENLDTEQGMKPLLREQNNLFQT